MTPLPPPPPAPHGPARPVAVPAALVPAVEQMIADHAAGVLPGEPLRHVPPVDLRPRPPIDLPLGVALSAIAATLTYLTAFVVPRFEAVFADFGTKLPTPTTMLLDLSRFVTESHGWIWIWAAVPLLAILRGQLRTWPLPRGRRSGWGSAVLLAVLSIGAIIVVSVVALYLPMYTLIQTVSGQQK